MTYPFSYERFAPALFSARTFSETYDITTDAIRALGFADWMAAFCAWKKFPLYSQETFLKCTYDRPVARRFLEERAIDLDCSIDVCLKRGKEMLWSEVDDWIRQNKLEKSQIDLIEFLATQGIYSGVSLPVMTSNPGFGGAGLAAKPGVGHDEFFQTWQVIREDTFRVVQAFHDHAALFGMVPPGQELTREQREVLEARLDGVSIDEIAYRLDISTAGVRSRLNTAHKNMGTNGFHELMLKATLTRQI